MNWYSKRGIKEIHWSERPMPNGWTEWYFYYDPRPVPFPRKCRCCEKIFRTKEEEEDGWAEHLRNCMCNTNLRSYPLSLDSDYWETLDPALYEETWRPYRE